MNAKQIYLLCGVALLYASVVYASVPNSLPVQGRLTDENNTYINTTLSFLFKIYDVATGGAAIYTASQSLTTDENGTFYAQLDNVDLPFDVPYYMGVTIGADNEMEPRLNLTSSAYSGRANVSDGLNPANNYSVNRLGIGTPAPTSPLHINSTGEARLWLESVDNSASMFLIASSLSRFSRIGFMQNGVGNLRWEMGNDADGSSNFYIAQGADMALKYLTLQWGTGNVGVGTTNPNENLTVAGNINATGYINATIDVCIEGGNCLSAVGTEAAIENYVYDADNNPSGSWLVNVTGNDNIIDLTHTDAVGLFVNNSCTEIRGATSLVRVC